jgi:hypothetical protein
MKFIALIGLLALTACGTYAVRVYDYHGAAERGEASAEAPAPAERGDKGKDHGGKGHGKGDKGKDKGEDD